MAVPALLKMGESQSPDEELRELEASLDEVSARAKAAGFELNSMLAGTSPMEKPDEEEVVVSAEVTGGSVVGEKSGSKKTDT